LPAASSPPPRRANDSGGARRRRALTAAGVTVGLDVGTSGVRAALVDDAGALISLHTVRLAATGLEADDPRAWWAGCEAVLETLGRECDVSAVRALAVDGTSGTLLAVDRAGTPVAPARMYHAIAAEGAIRIVADAAPAESAANGPASPLAKALALQDAPGAARILHQADWIAGRLRGQYDHTDENNALKTGYDAVARCWPAWLDDTGLRREMLPAVVAPGAKLGEIDPAVARRFGLSSSAIIVAGTTDGCASFLAAGACEIGDAVTALGSSMTLKLACDRPVVSIKHGVYSHRLGDMWLAGGASNSGGAALARYFDARTLEALSARIDPAHPSSLDYYPLPRPGERFPHADPGFAPRATPRPADDALFLQALLEGIAAIEAVGYQSLASLGAPALRAVRTVGGGARNATWTAIRARVLGVPIEPASSEEAAVGVACLALRALGLPRPR